MEIYPTVTTDDRKVFRRNLVDVRDSEGAVEWMQFDVIDGVFADNLTLGPEVVGEEEFAEFEGLVEWECQNPPSLRLPPRNEHRHFQHCRLLGRNSDMDAWLTLGRSDRLLPSDGELQGP